MNLLNAKFLSLTFILMLSSNLSFAAEYKVKMLNTGTDKSMMVFEPAYLKVNLNDKVTFVPEQKGAHNSTSIFTPKDAVKWKSKPDTEFTVSFDKPGVYLYSCEPHQTMGMVGTILVQNPVNLKEAKLFAANASKSMNMGKDRFEKQLANIK